MRIVELTLESGDTATFFLSGNFVVNSTDKTFVCRLSDGIHNNGGWSIQGSYRSIIEAIKNAKEV